MKGLPNRMKVRNKFQRALYIGIAVSLATVSLLSGWVQHVSAAQVTARVIRMSTSAPDANFVANQISFAVATTGNIGGVVVDFCSNTPIIGDTCNAPTGFDVNEATTTIVNQTGVTGLSVDAATTSNKLILARTVSSITAATVATIELGNGTTTGFHNPTPVGSFYARIYTYATTAAAQGHNQNTPTGYVDYGGVAMATAAVVNITARVMETLSFCVYPTAGVCGDDPSITIGHTVGTTTIIDDTATDTATTTFRISTNANGGASIRMKGDTLKSGSNDINPAGGTPVDIIGTAGTERFGLRLSTAGTGITAVSPYNHAANFGLVVTGAGADDITSTYGGVVATLAGPVNNSVSTITFAATASNTTTAGTYTAAQKLMAFGTF